MVPAAATLAVDCSDGQVEGGLIRVDERLDDGGATREDVDRRSSRDVAHREAAFSGVRGGGVVREQVERRGTGLVEVGRRRVARAGRERQGRRPEDRGAVVGGVGRGQGDVVVTGGQVERSGEVTRLEVVQGQLAVDVDVDRGRGDSVKHGEGGVVCRRSRCRGDEARREGESGDDADCDCLAHDVLLGGAALSALH